MSCIGQQYKPPRTPHDLHRGPGSVLITRLSGRQPLTTLLDTIIAVWDEHQRQRHQMRASQDVPRDDDTCRLYRVMALATT